MKTIDHMYVCLCIFISSSSIMLHYMKDGERESQKTC